MVHSLTIAEALSSCAQWREPRPIAGTPFRLACRISPPALEAEVLSAWRQEALPSGATELWTAAGEAELFVDVDYGQWGLKLLRPTASAVRTALERESRPSEFFDGDVVIGEFLGDQDLVVLDRTGHVLIARVIDDRSWWPEVGVTLTDFLTSYIAAEGEKFWERPSLYDG